MVYSPLQLAYFAHKLTLRGPADSMDRMAGALLDAQVDLNPHQIDAALFATSNPLSKGAILADEVGLGKTIEAGLLIAQRWAERKRRLLIITPANLRKQWHQELADKFGLPAVILEAKSFRQAVKDGTTNPFDRITDATRSDIVICSYPLQKFDSDTERRFAIILERDALKWLKPAKGQFQIYYKLGTEQPEYIPDFVAETDTTIYMVETKARGDINTQEVQAKAAAAARWCAHASDHAASVGSKPWKYLLVPHDEIVESKRLTDFLRYQVVPAARKA